jgi:uncharacterized membrane protein
MFSVTLNGWILALHVLAAFALIGSLTLFTVATAAGRRIESPDEAVVLGRTVALGTVAITIGFIGTIVLGIWLVLSLDAYALLDGWIIAAIVLWFVTGALSHRSLVDYAAAMKPESGEEKPGARPLLLHVGASACAIAILVLMIWKPGA